MDDYPDRFEIVAKCQLEQIANLLRDYFFSSSPVSLGGGTFGYDDRSSLYYRLEGIEGDGWRFRDPYMTVRGYVSRTVLLISIPSKLIKQKDIERIKDMYRNIKKKMEDLGIEIISFEPPDLQTSSSLELWERIPNNGKDQMIVKYWNEGDSNRQIAQKLDFVNILSVTNAVSKLRRDNPGLVLTAEERKRKLRKNG